MEKHPVLIYEKTRRTSWLFLYYAFNNHLMKRIFICIIIILQSTLTFSQSGGLICPSQPCECQSHYYLKKNLVNARLYSDYCIKKNNEKSILNPKTWFYRGLIYQKVYEVYDSIYSLLNDSTLDSSAKSHFKDLYHNISKDSVLNISMESYLKAFCYNIQNDTLSTDKIIYDSNYRIQQLEKFKTYEFKNIRYVLELRDIFLPQILDYVAMKTFSLSEEDKIYTEIFWGIIENTGNIE